MKMSKVFPSKYLKSPDLNGKRVTVTIRKLAMELMTLPGKKPEEQPVIFFERSEKGLVLNKVNSDVISSFYGDESDYWPGKQITLYSTTITAFGEEHEVIRVAKKAPTPGSNPPGRAAAAIGDMEDEDTFGEDDFSDGGDDLFEPDNSDARSARGQDQDFYPADPGARIGNQAARPVNNSNGPCPECHAPVGRPHATGCKAAGTVAAARIDNQAARPAPPALGVDTRPVAQVSLPLSPDERLYGDLAAMYDSSLPLEQHTTDLIRKARNANLDSTSRMTDTYLKALRALLQENLATSGDEETYMLLTALLGYRVSAKAKPGQLVHGYMIKPLREGDTKFIESLMEVLTICRELVEVNTEEEDIPT